jgi:peptidase inhibitor I78 family protein
MRSVTLLAPALLVACSTAPAEPVVHGETPGHTCNPAGTERFLGQAGTAESGAAIKRATHAAVLRWAPPGYMITMDFRADRVTVKLDESYKITAINCG